MTADGVVRGTTADGNIEVEFSAPLQCRGCEGLCMWRSRQAVNRTVVSTTLRLAKGDRVTISLPHRYLLVGTLLVHGLPWAALLAGAAVGFALTGTDLGCLVGAVGGVVTAGVATPSLRRRTEKLLLGGLVVERARTRAS